MPPPSEYLAEKEHLKELERERAEKIRARSAEKMEKLRYQLMYGQEWGGIQPQPRYRPAFYEALGGLPGSRPYLDWFESRFPALVSEFQATLKTYKGFLSPAGAAREAEEIGESWADWLKGKRPELKERWYSLSPWQRGERPSYFAPRIQTLAF